MATTAAIASQFLRLLNIHVALIPNSSPCCGTAIAALVPLSWLLLLRVWMQWVAIRMSGAFKGRTGRNRKSSGYQRRGRWIYDVPPVEL